MYTIGRYSRMCFTIPIRISKTTMKNWTRAECFDFPNIPTGVRIIYSSITTALSSRGFPSPGKQWALLGFTKVLYLAIWIVIPLLFFNMAWWQILIGFFIMHYVAGLILSVVFLLAHVVGDTEIYEADESGTMKNTWAIHQLFTTVNFGTNNWLVNWYTGGLNHQVEHHIFPNISHVHYKSISQIVKETALEHNLPYKEYETTRKAIIAHFGHLKQMGLKPAIPA